METQIFNFTANGLQKAQAVPNLPIGTRVFAYGAGMCESIWATYKANENGSYSIVKISNHDYDDYFINPLNTLERYARPIKERFGIGFYYDLSHTFTQEEISEALQSAEQTIKKQKQAEKQKAAADSKEIAELPAKYPHLCPKSKEEDWYKQLRSNIVADIKKAFPDLKFSIKKRSYDCIEIYWINGVTVAQMKDITNKWEDHKTDFTGDFRDYSPSNFNLVFGGIKYLFEQREISEEIEALVDNLTGKEDSDKYEKQNALYRLWYKTQIPAEATNFRIERNEIIGCGSYEDFYKIMYDLPEVKPVQKVETPSGIKIIDYSEKAFAICGDTKPIKEQLKAAGGRFNFRLSCGAGWIFPKSKLAEIKNFLSL